MRSSASPPLLIRRARPRDQPWLADLADRAFSIYGSEYDVMIPAYARDARIVSLVAEWDGQRAGFLQVGFVSGTPCRPGLVADVLAVAVEAPCRGMGVGTALFRRAFSMLQPMLERGRLKDVQLTVADSNSAAARLFRHLGFAVLEANHGTYEGGQRAVRMSLWARYLMARQRGEDVRWPPDLKLEIPVG